MPTQSFAVPYAGGSASSCGYCSSTGQCTKDTSYKDASMHALRLSCEVYQKMIDRGWRRAGTYCYKPDMKRSCCPQYTIKLDALAFKAGKSHRKLVHRWNKYVIYGEGATDTMDGNIASKRSKGKDNKPFDLAESLHASEEGFAETTTSHAFEIVLEPASYSAEKFDLFCKYQTVVHNDTDNQESNFTRFLVETPLVEKPIPYTSTPRPAHLPLSYGSYHQLYRLDGKLIAMSILDILPDCVSSVYFMYDSLWERFSLGKLSALREVSLAKEMHDAGAPAMGYLYMGFYIYSCQKMRYKGEYSPSFLADPETFEWHPLEKCIPLLQRNRYATFSDPGHCVEKEAPQRPLRVPEPSLSELDDLYVLKTQVDGEVIAVPIGMTNYWKLTSVKEDFCACIAALGLELAKSIIWTV